MVHLSLNLLTCVLYLHFVTFARGDLDTGEDPDASSLENLEENLRRMIENTDQVTSANIVKGKGKRHINSAGQSESNNKFQAKDPKFEKKYLNEWVINLTGGKEIAKKVVEDIGYKFHGPVQGFEDVYRVSHQMKHHNHKREATYVTSHISSQSQVLWAEQQISSHRVKRRFPGIRALDRSVDGERIKKIRQYEKMFNDKLWKHQWYLFDSRTRDDLPELDLKVITVWNSGITGNGVNISILDDGLEWTHEDLVNSYNPSISYDFNDDDSDPMPRYGEDAFNFHGTNCAGEIAMQPNNSKCGVGIAYGASIGGVRMLDGDITDRIEGASLAMGIDGVDIISCSWGPTDDGELVEGPGTLARMAMENVVKEGRDGKGTIIVWAAGNGGNVQDNCNCDGYASSIETISVSSASESGESPWYSEHCASTITSMYSSGAYSDQKVVSATLNNQCTIDFSGTSASAPLVAGIIALALEVNPSLTWRDVQHAVVQASDWTPLSRDNEWNTNGAGFKFNIKFGFGLLTAEAMVNVSRNWTTVPEKNICQVDIELSGNSTLESRGSIIEEFNVSCEEPTKIQSLEHVQLLVSIDYNRRGNLQINLTSPSGTTTKLLTPRPKDASADGFCEWPFTSVHFWGENPNGSWRISLSDVSDVGGYGQITALSLVLHGIPPAEEISET